jgi:hypothetical protein
MLVNNREILILLIGEHSVIHRVCKTRGTKKVLKLSRANIDQLMVGLVWKQEGQAARHLMSEFPEVFKEPPDGLPPLRWTGVCHGCLGWN